MDKSIFKWIIITVILGIFIAGGDMSPATIMWLVVVATFVAISVFFSLFVAKVIFKGYNR